VSPQQNNREFPVCREGSVCRIGKKECEACVAEVDPFVRFEVNDWSVSPYKKNSCVRDVEW